MLSPLNTYLVSRFLTTIAYQIEALAVGWQVYSLRKDPLDLGWIGLAQFAPMLMFSLFGGQLADRFDRKRILFFVYLAWMFTVVLMALATLKDRASLELFLVLLFVQGTLRAMSNPSAQALVTQVVEDRELRKGIALAAMVWQLSTILGPLLGGILYSRFGGALGVYLIAAAFSFLGILLLTRVQMRAQDKMKEKMTTSNLFSGIHYVRKRKVILGCISLDLFAVLFGGATALLPAYASDILHIGPTGLGILRSAPAFGAILMSLWLAQHPIKTKTGRWLFFHVVLFGLATIGFGLSRDPVLSFLMLFICGASDMVSVVVRMSLVQSETPPEMRGRVSAVNSIFISASNELGEFESGMTAHWFGVIPAVVLGGVGSVVVAALWSYLFPQLREMDQ